MIRIAISLIYNMLLVVLQHSTDLLSKIKLFWLSTTGDVINLFKRKVVSLTRYGSDCLG